MNKKTTNYKNEDRMGEKQFITRNSLLTDLFENNHIRTIYHMFIATFVGLFINTVLHDFMKNGELIFGLKLIRNGFANLHIALLGTLGYFLGACLAYVCFKFWARCRNQYSKLKLRRIWDLFWAGNLLIYYIISFQSAYYLLTFFKLPPPSAAIVSIEQTRILMKIHSFIRYNSPKVLRYKLHGDTDLTLPSFSYFVYFMFVPTLLYRDSYPRTPRIRWRFVLLCLLEIISVIFSFSCLIERFFNPSIRDFGVRKYTLTEIVLCSFDNISVGVFILLFSFFLILHSWQNLFAELLCFGDRLFYRDWWTCTDYTGYFRKWNIIVQEWLYVHIYKDSRETLFKNYPVLAKVAVFLISAVVHEWILTCMFGFFMPLLFLEFLIFGSLLNSVGMPKTGLFNVLFLYSISLGMGHIATIYGVEYFTRMNAPVQNQSWGDFMVPKFLQFIEIS